MSQFSIQMIIISVKYPVFIIFDDFGVKNNPSALMFSECLQFILPYFSDLISLSHSVFLDTALLCSHKCVVSLKLHQMCPLAFFWRDGMIDTGLMRVNYRHTSCCFHSVWNRIKEIIHLKIKILSLFTHPRVISYKQKMDADVLAIKCSAIYRVELKKMYLNRSLVDLWSFMVFILSFLFTFTAWKTAD